MLTFGLFFLNFLLHDHSLIHPNRPRMTHLATSTSPRCCSEDFRTSPSLLTRPRSAPPVLLSSYNPPAIFTSYQPPVLQSSSSILLPATILSSCPPTTPLLVSPSRHPPDNRPIISSHQRYSGRVSLSPRNGGVTLHSVTLDSASCQFRVYTLPSAWNCKYFRQYSVTSYKWRLHVTLGGKPRR